MEDAWQSQDMAPSNGAQPIGIPLDGTAPMVTDSEPYSRRSRSRSPGREDRGRGGDPGGANPGNNLHVSGLSHRVDNRQLEEAFGKIGRVQKVQVMYDPHTRDSRGFAFVTMESAEEGDAAITALNSTEFMGKTMNVSKARRARGRTPTPGKYYGPPKRGYGGDGRGGGYDRGERPYDPRPYDSRYARDFDDRGPPRRGGGGGRYDDGYRRDRDYERGGGGYRDDYKRDDYRRDYDRGGRYEERRY